MSETSFLVRDFMSNDIVAASPEESVAEALARMEKHGIHEMPVMEKSAFRGWVSYRSLVRRGSLSTTTKLANVMQQPPKAQKDSTLFEVADLMIRNNVRALPVVDRKGQLVGVLSRTDILRAALQIPSIANLPLQRVMNPDLETVEEKESIDQAVRRLRENNINQLLVINAQGRLEGVARLESLLSARWAEHEPKTSRQPRGGTQRGSNGHKTPRVDLSGFVEDAATVPPHATLGQAIQQMQKNGLNCAVIVDANGFAAGIVSRSNVVERVARLMPQPAVPLCQIVGLNDHVDPSQLDSIHEMSQRTLKKVEREVNAEFLSLHYKVYKAKNEGDSKFSLTAHLSTEGGFWVQKGDAWDALEVTRDVLDHLERRILERKELRLENRKHPSPRMAAFYTATEA